MLQPEVDPYKKVCAFRFCRKPFTAKRTNNDYCTLEHKRKENNYKQRLKRQLMKPMIDLVHVNERVLQHFYESRIYLVSLEQLVKAGYDFNAHVQRLTDRLNSSTTLRCLDYGIQTKDQKTFKIVFFKEETATVIMLKQIL